MRLILIVLYIVALISCVENTIQYDMSSSGAVNSIKEINGEVYILNSTNSSILKLTEGKTELFRDLEVEGRDFLLDFDIDGDAVYYSNTYDEIFKAKSNVIEDTIKIMSPDRIEVIGDRIFITSRKAEEGFFYLISADKVTGEITAKTALNDSPVAGGVFSTVSISASEKGLWIINTFRNRLEQYGNDLELKEFYDLADRYDYGNFIIDGDKARIICSGNGIIFVCTFDLISGEYDFGEKMIGSDNIDVSVSAVTEEDIYAYDYISGIIILLR